MELPQALHRASPQELQDRIRAERRAMAFILLRDATGTQRIVELGDDVPRLTIGREPTSHVALDWDGEASRLHAELECIEGQWTVVDDGRSRNGTFLNGDRIAGRRRLRDGDVVRAGRTLMLFRAPSGRESRRTEPADEEPVPQITDAQRRVLVAVCRPFAGSAYAAPASTREVAEELFVSVDTVKTHLRALFEAFGVEQRPQNQKRAELVRRAFELGVVAPSDFR